MTPDVFHTLLRVLHIAGGLLAFAVAPLILIAAKGSPTRAPKPAAPIKVASPIKNAPPPSIAGTTGGWRIQLGAFGQRAAAEALFARLRGKLGASTAYYLPVGAVTRLQAGPYDSRAAASAACAALGGQPCFAVLAR